MKPTNWSILAIVIGLAVAFLGPVIVGWIVPVESLWTDADANAKARASADWHSALHAHAHGNSGQDHSEHGHAATGDVDLVAAQTEAERHQARLDGLLPATAGCYLPCGFSVWFWLEPEWRERLRRDNLSRPPPTRSRSWRLTLSFRNRQ